MDPENNDLEKVVERYNKMISFPDNKKLEWEDDDYIEENVGWEKIESAEQLKKHMEQHKDLKDMTPTQLRSHRMKMITRLSKGMSMAQAHKDIMGQ